MTRAPRTWLPALALLVLVLASSAAFIIAFTSRFGLSHAVIPLHLVLVLGVLGVTILATVLVDAALPRWPRLAAMPLALVLAALLLVDAVNWVARGAWMEVISLRTMVEYAPRVYAVAAGATAVNGLRT